VVFPLVALFHIFWWGVTLVTFIQTPGSSTAVSCAWMLGYASSWTLFSVRIKWGGMVYIGITVADLVLHHLLSTQFNNTFYGSPLYLLDIAFSFFILFYFKRLG
jgi:hypothetical protein